MVVVTVVFIIILIIIMFVCYFNKNSNKFLFYTDSVPTSIYPNITTLKTNLLKFKISSANFACPTSPSPTKNLELQDIYKKINGKLTTERIPDNIEKNRQITEPIRIFKDNMGNMVIKLVQDQDNTNDIVKCIQTELLSWANAGAYTGNINSQGYVELMFLLVHVELVYLKIKPIIGGNSAIETWIEDMDKLVWNRFKERGNNLTSWATLTLMLDGIATNNANKFSESVSMFKKQVNNIDNDGYVPSELLRGERASSYLIYYAEPIIIMQYILKTVNNSAYNQPKIYNFINIILAILKDKQYLVKQKMVTEKQIEEVGRAEFLTLYDDMFKAGSIKVENKSIYDSLVNLYKSNINYDGANLKLNLTSLFGI